MFSLKFRLPHLFPFLVGFALLSVTCWAVYHNSSWNFPEGKWTAISLGNNPWGLKKGMPGNLAMKPFANDKLLTSSGSATHHYVNYLVEREGEVFLVHILLDMHGNLIKLETFPDPQL